MFKFRLMLSCVVGLGSLALVACDETPGADGGVEDGSVTMMDSGGGGTDAGEDAGGSEDAGGGEDAGGEDAGGEDGGGLTGCAAEAEAFCAQLETCNPTGLLAGFENGDICRRVRAASCEDPVSIPMSGGVADEDACEAEGVADCDGLLGGGPTSAACTVQPGEITESMGACFSDVQCGERTIPSGDTRRQYCRPLLSGSATDYGTAECPRGQCIVARALGASCNPTTQATGREFCDRFAGQFCTQGFDADDGTDGMNQCREIQYGGAGASCFPGTEMQCGAGFECDPEGKVCMAALTAGQTCIPDRNLCDSRIGLTCTDGGAGDVCTPPRFVNVGAQCGTVTVGETTEMRNCSAYARCDTEASTSVCVALVPLGEICTVDPDNCEPGLECNGDTNRCVVPTPDTTCD